MAAPPPALVTRTIGLSSVATHRDVVIGLRRLVDVANRLRLSAMDMLLLYVHRLADDPNARMELTDGLVVLAFQLLTGDAEGAPALLRSVAREYRDDVLAAEGVTLCRSGAMGRICNSFRVNVKTAIANQFNYPESLQKSYLIAKYGREAGRALAPRLRRSREELGRAMRAAYATKMAAQEHKAVEDLALDPTNATASASYAAAGQRAGTAAQERVAFEAKTPLPDALSAACAAEVALLPDRDDMDSLARNYVRMARFCNVAGETDRYQHRYCVGPTAGFATDFVPFDKETLRQALAEMQAGKHGATPGLQAHLRAKLVAGDPWGLHVAFDEAKLRKLHCLKHTIDAQLLTDGVRVIVPLRTHAASAVKAASAKASGWARSTAGKLALVSALLTKDEAVEYEKPVPRHHLYHDTQLRSAACGLRVAPVAATGSRQPAW